MAEYLAIKNWDKYQSGKKGWDWIKDYVNQNDDEDLSALSMFERGLLQELRRLRGRSGKNIHNSIRHIAGAIHAMPTDRSHLRHAIDRLIAGNILFVTNQQVDSLEERRGEEKRGEKEEAKPVSPSADANPKFKLPGWIEKQTWEDYEQMRRRIGKPMTDRARNLAVDRLAALQNKGHPVIDVLKQSIFNSWQGVFEIRGNGNGKQSKLERTLQNFHDLELEERSQAAGAGHGAAVSGAGVGQGKHSGHG